MKRWLNNPFVLLALVVAAYVIYKHTTAASPTSIPTDAENV